MKRFFMKNSTNTLASHFSCVARICISAALAGSAIASSHAYADDWELPALVEPRSDGLYVITTHCNELSDGDLITHIDHARITSKNAAGTAKRLSKHSKTLQLSVIRGNLPRTEHVALIRRGDLQGRIDSRQVAIDARNAAEAARKLAVAKTDMENWLQKTAFKDRGGKEWSKADIDAHNQAIVTTIDRNVMLHSDAKQDELAQKSLQTGGTPGGLSTDFSIGYQIETGYMVVLTLRDILALPPGGSIQRGPFTYRSLRDYMTTNPNATDALAKGVELLFRYTDGDRYLIPCRDGRVISALEAWERAVHSRRE